MPLYGDADPEPEIERCLSENGEKLERLYAQYLDDTRASPLLFQPEAIVIFDLLHRARVQLEQAFSDVAPRELLEDLAVAWGEPFDEPV